MGYLYIVRHGQTEWNIQGRMQGRLDSPLTDHGVEQALRLAAWLLPVPFKAIYSSSAGRALATAQILHRSRPIPLTPRDSLMEVALGPWEGKLKTEIQDRWPEAFRDFWESPQNLVPLEGMETFPGLENRCRQALTSILDHHRGENILVVTHGVTASMLLNVLEGRAWPQVFTQPFPTQTSVSLVDFHRAKPLTLYRCRTDHLENAPQGTETTGRTL